MRKNPYLKQEQEFRPLLMRGSLGNDFLDIGEHSKDALEWSVKNITKETYSVGDVTFEMIRSPSLDINGSIAALCFTSMCSTECTQALFEAVMGFNPSKTVGSLLPVVNVSLYSCALFCNKLSELFGYKPCYVFEEVALVDVSRQTGIFSQDIVSGGIKELATNGFRLPTRDEWLAFAKAGGSITLQGWVGTSNEAELGDYAWYEANTSSSFFDIQQVATKKPNKWGMYDMSGNVEEWLYDERCTDANYLGASKIGGSTTSRPSSMWYYSNFGQATTKRSSKDNKVGFRFARTIGVKE